MRSIIWPTGERYGEEIARRQDDMLDDWAFAFAGELMASTRLDGNTERPFIIDLAGASGYMASRFVRLGLDATVVDKGLFSFEVTSRRRYLLQEGHFGKLAFKFGDAWKIADLGLPQADIIYCSCLGHFARPEQNLDLLLQARRVLKPGGRFYFRVTGGYEHLSPRYFQRGVDRRFRKPFFLNPQRLNVNVPAMDYSCAEVYSLFFAAGFKDIRVRRAYKSDFFYAIAEATNPPLMLAHTPQRTVASDLG